MQVWLRDESDQHTRNGRWDVKNPMYNLCPTDPSRTEYWMVQSIRSEEEFDPDRIYLGLQCFNLFENRHEILLKGDVWLR